MTTPLITYEELRNYPLPVKGSQWDSIGQSMVETTIEYASQNIMDYVDLGIASAYYTERIPGSGTATLMLDQYPLLEVVSVTQLNRLNAAQGWTLDYFVVDTGGGMITWADRTRYAFYKDYDYSVYYRAGWLTIPGPIKHAVALQTIQMLQPMFRGGQNFTEIKLIDGVNEEIVDLLEKYKRKRIG